MKRYILAIDQGTTGSRAILFDAKGKAVSSAYQEFRQYFPKPGWVEHNAEEIWMSCVSVIRSAVAKSGIDPARIAAIGITNQRETTVLWDKRTGRPVHHAIVWQCRRTSELCRRLKKHEPLIQRRTGLVFDPYFSGTKIRWLLDHVPGLRRRVAAGRIAFGTIDSWLIWKLTGGKSHVTDLTNASRTLLLNIRTKRWDPEILSIFGIPKKILPSVQKSGSIFGHTQKIAGLPAGIPIAGVMGDQQAALYGQGCFEAGTVKNTYGTGCFIVLNTGKKFVISKKGLLTTLACDFRGRPVYALEGSVFIAGAVVQWLRDSLKLIKKSSDTERAIRHLRNTQGVYVVPAFTGLGAPYWVSGARGLIAGITRGTTSAHIIRASLESIAYQTKDVFDLMERTFGRRILELRVDGGACKNNFLMQFQADLLNVALIRPRVVELTAKGVADLAAVTSGIFRNPREVKDQYKVHRIFRPGKDSAKRGALYAGWLKAVAKTVAGEKP
ncbi:MAG TPA: glycerol kinase GlpK [Candidatus Omnitrophota bacterium]|nr:glycerol kinase GlpK [Candidatus Omnitrophota bacterium]HPS36692.1 glycerol kinase GlpK [Candidatus Omnitrophota bacterium]